jgi:hypothetical protein
MSKVTLPPVPRKPTRREIEQASAVIWAEYERLGKQLGVSQGRTNMQHIPPVPPPGRNDTVTKSGKPMPSAMRDYYPPMPSIIGQVFWLVIIAVIVLAIGGIVYVWLTSPA